MFVRAEFDQRDCNPADWTEIVDILERLNELFQDVFDDDSLQIGPDTSAHDVQEWDSLMHVNLLLTVEKWFDVRFSSSEVARLQNVGELIELIGEKKGQSESAL